VTRSILRKAGSGRRGAAVVALVAIGLLTAGCGDKGSASAPVAATAQPVPTSVTATPSASTSPSASAKATSGSASVNKAKSKLGALGASGSIRAGDISLVAQSKVSKIKVYRTAGAKASEQSIARPAKGPLVFLVQERKGDRLRVLLPVRPNESQGWVEAGDVKLSQVDYRITVSAKAHQLKLYREGKVVMTEPVGLGKGTTPTPGGVFYLKELLRPTNPKGDYGPYAYGLSGYSNVLHEFLGGNGQIGIHGTNEPSSVGKDVSHGCIRMNNKAITKLAKMLPLGVPVQMIA
jgi:lipoprotein-anchoring transpeptidase ErfK/SrfK